MPSCIKTSSSSSTTNQACAACKYQRRKCAPDCLLAPYFPYDRHRQFLNAHKLFGVSNITKIIKSLVSPLERDAAMHTIMFQSDARANFPVGGCYDIIRDLQYKIQVTRNELETVLQQLALFRHQEPQIQIQETKDLSIFTTSYDLNQGQQQQQQYSSSENLNGLQEDMWSLQLQDPSTTSVDMNNTSLIDESEQVKPFFCLPCLH